MGNQKKESPPVKIFFTSLISLLLFIAFLFPAHSAQEEEKNTVATVNGEKITSDQLSERAQIFRIFMALKSVPEFAEFLMETKEGEEVLDTYRDYVLEKLIEEELILQEGEERGIKVNSKEIEERLSTIIDRTEEVSSKKELLQKLKKDQRTLHDLKKEIYRKLAREKLKKRIVEDVSVSESEIRQYYEKNKDSFRDAGQNIPPLSEVKAQIREKLKKDRKDALWQKWVKKIKAEAIIVKNLTDKSE